MSDDMDTLPVEFPEPITPRRHGDLPWEFYSGSEECFEGDCGTETWPCAHVTPEIATFGDVYIRERLERLLYGLRVQLLSGASGDDLLDQLDSGVSEIAAGFADDIDAMHGSHVDLADRKLFGAVADDEKLVADVEAILAKSAGEADV